MPHDAEQEFDPRAYLLSGDDFEWVLNDHGYKFSGRVGQLDRPEQDRDPIYSKNVRTVSPDIVLEQSSSGKKIARVILAYFGSHFSQRFTSPPTLNRYLGELETAIEANSHNAMIALDKRWDRRGEREKDVIGEAFEQPGPDMPDEGQVPGEQSVDDFDVREYFLADNTKGAERLKWLDKHLNDGGRDLYLIPNASSGYSSDFDEEANYG
jgi:hypothetical protein